MKAKKLSPGRAPRVLNKTAFVASVRTQPSGWRWIAEGWCILVKNVNSIVEHIWVQTLPRSFINSAPSNKFVFF